VTTPTEKRCADQECNQVKPASDFYISKINSDGLGSYCKKCETKMARKDWVPYKERKQINPFDETGLFKNLNLAAACIGMAEKALCQAAAGLILTTDTKPEKAIYWWSKSAIILAKQVSNHLTWIIEAKRFQENERQANGKQK